MGNPLTPFLEQQGFAMLDGGLATEMEARGADLDHLLWSARMLAESPDLVRAVHYDYLAAGADIIATATYQASFGGFEQAGYGRRRATELMRLSVDLAVEARDAFWSADELSRGRLRPLVAASIGPFGACRHDGSEYHGNYGVGRQDLLNFHRERMDLLADMPADLFVFETIPSQLEAEVLIELLADYPGKYAWLSFSCRDGTRVCHGESFADCAALAEATEQIVAVGVNCTAPEHIDSLLQSVRSLHTPRVVYPNRGEQWVAGENRWAGQGRHGLTAVAWYRLGARLLGGCCRTGPEDIRRMRAELLEVV
ncbi:MAG: homocysteine S-methyltransferase [Lysobacterales bacterium]